MKRNFVFGNGRTRLNINFDEVKPYGLIYACNAVFREYTPDFLIAVDLKMIEEINKSGYQNANQVYTYQRNNRFKGFNFIDPNLGWSSGPTALKLSTENMPDEIYLFGFDFEGLNGKLNNVYANTSNYKKSTEKATYYGNWMKQTETVIKNNSKIKFIRVTVPKFYETDWKYDNYNQIVYEDFRKVLVKWEKIR